MKVNRLTWIFQCTIITILLSNYDAADYDAEPSQTDTHKNYPRFFGIFSRPKPEVRQQHGTGLKQHIGNVLNGGTIGFHAEFRPFAHIQGFMDHAKKFIPSPEVIISGVMGGKYPDKPKPGYIPDDYEHEKFPDYHEPRPKPEKPGYYEPRPKPEKPGFHYPRPKPEQPDYFEPKPEKPGYHEPGPKHEKPDHGSMEAEGPFGWEHGNPKKPVVDGPKWEDIGEDVDESQYEKVPIEDIIQPRLRPKRFIESKVYHMPLEFLSNAKPFHVTIRAYNHT